MAFVNLNPFGKVHATFKDTEQYAHKESYWARLQRKDGTIEYRYLKALSNDHKMLEKEIAEGDVKKVILFEEKEMEDIKGCFERAAESVEAVVVLAHILKNKDVDMMKEDGGLLRKGFPHDDGMKLIGEANKELEWINGKLTALGNLCLGEAGKSG